MKKDLIPYTLIIMLLVSVTFLLKRTSMLYAFESTEIIEKDQQECHGVVDEFCQAWTSEQYETMYQALSKEGMGKMDKEKFISTYKEGRLTDYLLKEVITKEDNVLVKVNLKFQTEIKPRFISGVHTFNMEKDEGSWRIKYIMPPIKAPRPLTLPGGSHPGD